MSQNDKAKGEIGFLVIFIILLKYIVEFILDYWVGIVTIIGIILGLCILFFTIAYLLKQRKIRQVRESDVISIPSQTLYSIPIEVEELDYETNEGDIKSRWMVMSFRPELNNNNLNFVQLNYELGRVKVLRREPKQDFNYEITKQISSLTKEIFLEIDPQLSRFEEQYAELERLEKLVSSSDVYHSKTHLYRRSKIQVQQLIDQAENLKSEYCKCIKEILIEAEISQFDPNIMSDILEKKIILHSKYEIFKTDFQNRKDEINIYNELSKSSILP